MKKINLLATRVLECKDSNVISDDIVNDITEYINGNQDGYDYSTDQVRFALWSFLNQRIDSLIEELDRFWDDLPPAEKEDYLGEPEIDSVQEAIYAEGDAKYDEMIDRKGEK